MSYHKAILDRLETSKKYGDNMQSSRLVCYEDCLHLTVEHHKSDMWLLSQIQQAMLANNDYKLPLFDKIKKLNDDQFNKHFIISGVK
jgi:hypothetical protein